MSALCESAMTEWVAEFTEPQGVPRYVLWKYVVPLGWLYVFCYERTPASQS